MFNSSQSDLEKSNIFSSDNLNTSVNEELIKVIRIKSTELVQECQGFIQAYQDNTNQELTTFKAFLKKRSDSMGKILTQWEQQEKSTQEIQQQWIQEEKERLAIMKQFLPAENRKSKVAQGKIQYYEMLTEGDIANSAIKVLILEMRALKEEKSTVCRQCILDFSQQQKTELVALFLDFLQSNYSEKDFIAFLKTKVTVERNARDFQCTLKQFTHEKILQEVDVQKEAGKLGRYMEKTERAMEEVETLTGPALSALQQENETLKLQLDDLVQQCDELRDLLDAENKEDSQEKGLNQRKVDTSRGFFAAKKETLQEPYSSLTPPHSPPSVNANKKTAMTRKSQLPERRQIPVFQRKTPTT